MAQSAEAGVDGSRSRRPARIVWEGPFYATQSLALVNRELCAGLIACGCELSLHTGESASVRREAGALPGSLEERVGAALSGPADLVIRHHWPPNLEPVASGRLAVVQPWEFGSLPREWIAPMNAHVDEVWAYTPYVQECYVRSGVDPERVKVVPLGVDPVRFHPEAPPLKLATGRSFKFLFVGGTIYRKGIDILLEAYARAFNERDDVCLVVKGMGSHSFYRGQDSGEMLAAWRDRPGAPELLVLDEDIPADDMPGLYTAADCLVHPYRGEGFGLPIAEAMACARPAVVTGHGAALAFCDEHWGYMIPAREVELPEARVGDIPTVARPWLAEPDRNALVGILRRVADDPREARRRGYAAREQLRTRFTWEHACDAALERVNALLAAPQRDASLHVGARAESGAACGASSGAGSLRAEATPDDPARDAQGCASVSTPEAAASERGGSRPNVVWNAAPFNYSGYARISRVLLPELERRGHPVQLAAFGTDERFATAFNAELARNPNEAALWSRLVKRQVRGGVGVCFHPPVAWDGYGFFSEFRRKYPGLDAYVGFTMFETDRLPRDWADECNEMDEVWVPSEFNREVFADSGVTPEKLRVFHPGIDTTPFEKCNERYPIPGRRRFAFLSVFQWTLRKGWDVLLDAWAQAFHPDDDVCLVLRAYPGSQKTPPIRERIDAHLRSRGTPPERCAPIVLIEEFIDDERMPALYAAADAFVLPTRGEAWGLPFLEAMASGLPTIAPDWSGHRQFMNDANSHLVEIEGLQAVDPVMAQENAYYTGDLRWAQPSVARTAERMRELFEAPDAARMLGERARAEVIERWSVGPAIPHFEALVADLAARAPARGRRSEAVDASARIFWNAPLFDPSGYADEARQFVLGLDELGMPIACKPIRWSERRADLPRLERNRLDALRQRRLGPDAVHVQHIFANAFRPTPQMSATVGRTMFETDSLPSVWVERCNLLDEIWVPSEFNRETFARAGVDERKLQVIPGPFDAERFRAEAEALAIDGRRGFAFLSLFDWGQRKGWDLLLRAWADEFHADDDVCLLLKTSSSAGLSARELRKRVRQFLKKRCGKSENQVAPILWLESDHASAQMPRVYRSADAYVMPSRGEGWGRPYMEAMACGLPVIATGWGGNTAFMTRDNSYLVESQLVPVSAEGLAEAPQFRGHRWAEPKLEHLRELLRRVFAERAEARAKGARARSEVLERFDRKTVARLVIERIDRLAPGAQRIHVRNKAEAPSTCAPH